MSDRPRIAVLVGHYLPGSKAGGPIRSVANLVAALGEEFDFQILARDRDLGDRIPYPQLNEGWSRVGLASVRYLSAWTPTRRGVRATIAETRPELVYCQSYFSPRFSIVPRILKRTGRLRCPLLVAPRGEFSPGALAQKETKKRIFLALGRWLRLDREVIWHATAPDEAEDIRRVIGPEARILVAREFATPDDRPLAPREKTPGHLEIVFLSRITPKKNLLGAIEILQGLEGVRLRVYGPKEDEGYWRTCLARAERIGIDLVDGGALAPEDVRAAFERAHLFLFPTFGENYGHVIMESLAAGTPVLVSDQTPWRNLRDEGTGWDLPLDDREGFRAAILQLQAMDGETFAVLSRRAYEAARERRNDLSLIEANRTLLQDALTLDGSPVLTSSGTVLVPQSAARERAVVAVLVGHYLPGSKGGGPIRSVANLVAALGEEFDFRILARDRDLGDTLAYANVPRNVWTQVGSAHVRYLPPEAYNWSGVTAALLELDPDVVYAQSYFSPLVSILPRVLKRTGKLRCPVLVAPRGEFSPGALTLKGRKKGSFLALRHLLGLDRGIVWHATAPEEADDIRRVIGSEARILVASPLPTPDDRPLALREKRRGEVELVFVSRITPKKNLLGAIETLQGLEGVRLTAYGPKEDAAYWTRCETRARELDVALVYGGVLAPEDVRGALERAHLFLFPTLGENYGHVIMESLSAGTPVLLSDQTPWRNLRESGIGWDLALEDRAGFRAAIQEVRAMDEIAFALFSRQAYGAARARREDPATIEANRRLLAATLKMDE